MFRPFPSRFLAVAAVLAVSGVAQCQPSCPSQGRKVVYDEFGYAAPAPCERAAYYAAWGSSGRFTPVADVRYSTGYSCYPPLRPAAGINAYDRPREMNWSW